MKKPAWALRLVLGTLVTIAVAVFFAGASGQESSAPPIGLAGQSQTLLADGQWLLTGGESQTGPVSAAYLWDPATGISQSLTGGLKVARAWHSASVVADGSVLIIGGVDDLGSTLSAAERFNPQTAGFSAVSIPSLAARSHHTTTLLSNGQLLIVGGFTSDGTTLANAELVDPRTLAVTPAGSLNIPRSGHSATLLADGTVLVQGGVDATGKPAAVAELYEPQQNRFVETSQTASNAPSPGGPLAVWTNPPDGAGNVPLNPVISIRFSEPLRVQTVNSSTVVLNGPLGTEIVKVVPAERGMLAFVAPQASLQPGTTYLVTIQGAEDNSGARISPTAFSFTTVAQASGSAPAISTAGGSGSSSDDQVWIPNGSNWVTGLPPSPWQSLPPLRAPSGVTALAGQVLKLDGQPLPGVTLEIGNQQVRSDGTGRFLLTGIPASKQLLTIDGGSRLSRLLYWTLPFGCHS